jgi:hypothetical protein
MRQAGEVGERICMFDYQESDTILWRLCNERQKLSAVWKEWTREEGPELRVHLRPANRGHAGDFLDKEESNSCGR